MKKLLLLATALLTLSTAHAELILHESFDRPVGNLNVGNTPAANNTDWYSFSGTSNYISVVEGSLSYEGYAEAAGKKVELVGNGADDLRKFAPITSGKVYVAAIINVDSLKPSGSAEYFLSLGDASNSNMWGRLYYRSVDKVGDNFTGFNLGVTKYAESSTAYGWADQKLLPKTDYLVVIEYEFVDGEKNDTVRLYINPTKSNKQSVSQCVQNYVSGTGKQNGASGKDDASKIASVNLRKAAATPGRVYVDEIKVATAWENLFAGESGETPVEEPEITATPAILQFGGQVFVGSRYTTKFVVKGKDLKGDITLSNKNSELTFDKTTIAKADAESENGVEVTATLVPVKSSTEGYITWRDTVSLVSEGATTAIVTTSWWTNPLVRCATVAELNAEAAKASGWDYVLYIKFMGKAVVSYQYNQSGIKLYIQDATAGVLISDTYWGDAVKQGDSISNFIVYADPSNAVGGMMYIGTQGAAIDVLSHDNEVTPKVVTLAELQANPANYLCQLVKLEGVTFANTDAFASGDVVNQGETTATINLIEGNDLIGTAKPAKADIIAISSTTTGKVLRVRGKQDVVAAPTAIENIAADSEVEIYTVSGMRVSELQPGVNIIRQGNKTFKVVR